jgi:hypothetical protein
MEEESASETSWFYIFIFYPEDGQSQEENWFSMIKSSYQVAWVCEKYWEKSAKLPKMLMELDSEKLNQTHKELWETFQTTIV